MIHSQMYVATRSPRQPLTRPNPGLQLQTTAIAGLGDVSSPGEQRSVLIAAENKCILECITSKSSQSFQSWDIHVILNTPVCGVRHITLNTTLRK